MFVPHISDCPSYKQLNCEWKITLHLRHLQFGTESESRHCLRQVKINKGKDSEAFTLAFCFGYHVVPKSGHLETRGIQRHTGLP